MDDMFAVLRRGTRFPGSKEGGMSASKPKAAATERKRQSHRDKVNAWRKKKRIHVSGTDVQDPVHSWTEMQQCFSPKRYIMRNLERLGFTDPTPIQMQAIPCLASGRDMIACAPTGSGKSLAFVLPMLVKLGEPRKKRGPLRALLVAPTRELAQQLHRLLREMIQGKPFRTCLLTKANAKTTFLGQGQDTEDNVDTKFDILVTTPLRLVHLLKSNPSLLSGLKYLVFDEADRLFDQGFVQQVDEILHACPGAQKALFSATIPEPVESMADSILVDPARIIVGSRHAALPASVIHQELVYAGGEDGKMVHFRRLLVEGLPPPVIIFVQSKDRAKQLFHELVYKNIHVDMITSDRTKAQRDNVVKQFRLGKIWVLIATDLMARGIDFKGVNLVVNFDFPQSVPEYIHRVGRTGRAGQTGRAITYFTDDDVLLLRSIANVMRSAGCEVPDWIFHQRKASKKERRMLKYRAPEREDIRFTSSYLDRQSRKKKAMVEASKRKKGRKRGRKGAEGGVGEGDKKHEQHDVVSKKKTKKKKKAPSAS